VYDYHNPTELTMREPLEMVVSEKQKPSPPPSTLFGHPLSQSWERGPGGEGYLQQDHSA